MHNLLQSGLRLLILTVLAMTAIQCTKQEGDDKIVPVYVDPTNNSNEIAVEWNKLMLELERYAPGYQSPIAARTSAYINIAAYEAIYPGVSDRYHSIAGRYLHIQIPTIDPNANYFYPIAMNNCYKNSLLNFYKNSNSEELRKILWLYDDINKKYSTNIDPGTALRSAEFGNKIAKAIYDWSKTDLIGDEAYKRNTDPNYVAPQGDGLWKPTFPEYGAALLPHWGNMRTFLATYDDLQLSAPYSYSVDPQSEMFKEAKFVHDLTKSAKAAPDGDTYWIGEFWSDDFNTVTFTPAGRWTAIATQVLSKENLNLVESAIVYAKVSMAISDAAVGSWGNKYKYNVMRPVDYIRTNMDAEWNTLLKPNAFKIYYTPQSPSYPSEHAAYAAAACGVLTDFFGSQYKLVDNCHKGRLEFRSDPRTFYSFKEMADEDTYSRYAAGVHFPVDGKAGLELGRKIASTINKFSVEK